jgi:DNA-binding MarR family transcriptional regulator
MRALCAYDRRGIYARLTEAGLEALQQAEPTQHQVLSTTLKTG